MNSHLREGSALSGAHVHDEDYRAGYASGYGAPELEDRDGDAGFDHATIEEAEEAKSVLAKLEARQEARKEGFLDKLKFWESTRPHREDVDAQLEVGAGGVPW